MKRHIKPVVVRALSLALCAVMALALLPTAQAAQIQPAVSKNLDKHMYGNSSDTTDSYLYENSIGGLTRVEYVYSYDTYTGEVVVEDYDSQFCAQSSRVIQLELPLWGGFYNGEDYNFLIFGQSNPTESDSVEVVRVVKYDKGWNRLGSVSLYGANTTIPFRAGNLRCTESNGYLYVRTSHQMYKSAKDGLNHQASMMFVVHESDMEITDLHDQVGGVDYVSHSFNQFILTDRQNYIVSLDHGDAYPRALLLQRYNNTAVVSSSFIRRIIEFPGNTGDNFTGCSVGGFAETSNGYVIACCHDIDGSNKHTYVSKPHLYFIGEDLSVTSIKDVPIPSDVYTFTPQLAPTGLDGGYMMWHVRDYVTTLDRTLYYVHYDASGNVGAVQTATAPLSDCAPIHWNGKVVWYTTNNSVPTFYLLDSSGITSRQAAAGTGTPAPAANTAYANTQTVLLDGKSVEFQTYALKDSSGNLTNYIKLRDLAYYLNGTRAQFSVDWGQTGICLTTGWRYTPVGSELSTPFSGNRTYRVGTAKTMVDMVPCDIPSIVLTDDGGGDYTYYQLRDMGRNLGFNVSYINGQVVINTSEPYSDAQ